MYVCMQGGGTQMVLSKCCYTTVTCPCLILVSFGLLLLFFHVQKNTSQREDPLSCWDGCFMLVCFYFVLFFFMFGTVHYEGKTHP